MKSVLKTDEDIMSMIWIFVFSIKFRMQNVHFFWGIIITFIFKTQNLSLSNRRNFHMDSISIIFCMKKNKLSQPAPIWDGCKVWLLDAVHRNTNEKCPTLLKILMFNECFGKYRLNMPFLTISDDVFTFVSMPCQLQHSNTVF